MDRTKKYAWVMDALSKTSFSTRARATKHFLMGKKEYLPKKKTMADMDAVIKCALCPNMCKFDCPVLEAGKNEATSPSGKMRIAYFIETDRLKGKDAFELMYKCVGCDACRQWCPFDFSVGDILKGVRSDIISKNKAPSTVLAIKEQLERNHILDERNFAIEGKEKGDILYFMGCTVLSKRGEIAEAMAEIFDTAGENYAVMGEEWCCGGPLHNLGFVEDFKKFAVHNVKKIRESKCKEVVCSCPTCAYIFKQVYPIIGCNIKVKVLHSSEYLFSLMKNKKIKAGYAEREYVYHDPCTLVRMLGIKEEPRKILKNIQGIVLKEAFFSREDTKCCGMGSQLRRTNPDIAEKIAKARVEELKNEAECIITSCPSCKTAFGDNVYDLSEIVVMGMK